MQEVCRYDSSSVLLCQYVVPRGIVVSALACGLISDFNAQAIKAAELPPAQREAIEGIIHDYVLKNPDVLIEALQNAQDKLNHEADAKATKVLSERASEIFDDPATPVGGNPKGNVNIVEFFDYRCPYASKWCLRSSPC